MYIKGLSLEDRFLILILVVLDLLDIYVDVFFLNYAVVNIYCQIEYELIIIFYEFGFLEFDYEFEMVIRESLESFE